MTRSGNLYKTVVIQDETAGIAILINMTDYYTTFPVGRRVFVKLKGLYIGAYNGLIQIGVKDLADPTNVETIPLSLVEQYLIKGVCNLTLTPLEVSITDLNNSYQSMLIKLVDVEFISTDKCELYADASAQLALNRTLKDAAGNLIILRISGFANFASAKTPPGTGSILAIFAVYNTPPQLVIRDLNDVNIEGECIDPELMNIKEVRNLYSGTIITIPANKKIKGIVISDKDNGNTDARNMVVQDTTGGIVMRFSSNSNFALNAEVEVDISGQELSTFNGLLQINNIPNTNATQTGTGTVIPKVATISQVNSNYSTWESTLVKIMDATITGGGSTYNGSKTLNDGTGTITLYTRSAASFSSTNYPTSPVDVTGILVPFNTTKQISIRNLSDVQ